MVFEYALDPKLVATWYNRQDYRFFIDEFGQGTPRIISRYPKRWKKLVWQAFESDDDFARKRMEVLLTTITEPMIARSNTEHNEAMSWLENAETEDSRSSFRAILASENPRKHQNVLLATDISGEEEKWRGLSSIPTSRNPSDMAAVVSGLLVFSKELIFVDPHFGPENARHRRPLEAFLMAVHRNRVIGPPEQITVLSATRADHNFFTDECQERLPRIIPRGLQVNFERIAVKDGGEALHNRYILGDVGGVSFGTGLDDDSAGGSSTDDVFLLSKELFQLRSAQYSDYTTTFERQGEPVVVTGTKRV